MTSWIICYNFYKTCGYNFDAFKDKVDIFFFLYTGNKNVRSQIKSSISRNNVTQKAAGREGEKNWDSRGKASTGTHLTSSLFPAVLGINFIIFAIYVQVS